MVFTFAFFYWFTRFRAQRTDQSLLFFSLCAKLRRLPDSMWQKLFHQFFNTKMLFIITNLWTFINTITYTIRTHIYDNFNIQNFVDSTSFFFHVSMSELFSISIHMHGTGCHTGENESGLDSFSIFEEGKIQYFGCF